MSLEKIAQLEADQSQLLYSGNIEDESIEVREWQQYRWLHIGDSSVQALMDLNNIDHIVLPNIQAMLAVLLFCPEPKSLLNLGLGGASLERYLNSKFSETAVRSIEFNKQIISLAKDYFNLPEKIDVVHDTAEHFLSSQTDSYNIVLCDIFVADKQDDCLYNERFYADINKCIDENGILAMNILPDSEEDVVNVLLPIKNYFGYIYLLQFSDFDNAIIFASRNKIPDKSELQKRADELRVKTDLDLTDIPDRLNVLLETV